MGSYAKYIRHTSNSQQTWAIMDHTSKIVNIEAGFRPDQLIRQSHSEADAVA
jgi:hypothetical protein